ncbi:MAG: sigma-70 family RNA polymerase sigma factor [Anaerolineales bacterium]|nr:sigma-70 family RNA polymerase sigma factor [Anaerolineales bacterium]MCZ2121782.1 sigma-70 family RNA polymerase sigma factor [Anaerolineales bacterium]
MNEEQTWVLQAQQGSEEAFTRLVETYQTPVFNLCYRMLGEPELAEDAAQETFLRAYQNLHRYDRARAFATWLLSIAAHYCIDRLRRRKFSMFSMDMEDEEGNTFELPDPDSPDPEAESIQGQTRDRVHSLLKDLDDTDRAAIIMRYWYDYSEVEIAESLSLTVSAVKSRLHRARKELAGLWQEQEKRAESERRPYESPAF